MVYVIALPCFQRTRLHSTDRRNIPNYKSADKHFRGCTGTQGYYTAVQAGSISTSTEPEAVQKHLVDSDHLANSLKQFLGRCYALISPNLLFIIIIIFFFIWRSLTWCMKIFSLHRMQTSSLPVTFKPAPLWRITVHLFPLLRAPSSLPRQTPWCFQNINKHSTH